MTFRQRVRLLFLCYLSSPRAARPIYRAMRKLRCQRILELGVGDGRRTLRLLEVAHLVQPGCQLRYTGADPFEDRSSPSLELHAGPSQRPRRQTAGDGLSLKQTYLMVRACGVPARLLPGHPPDTLAQACKLIHDIELVVIAQPYVPASGSAAWNYLARILSPRAQVWVELPRDQQAEQLTQVSHDPNSPAATADRSHTDAGRAPVTHFVQLTAAQISQLASQSHDSRSPARRQAA